MLWANPVELLELPFCGLVLKIRRPRFQRYHLALLAGELPPSRMVAHVCEHRLQKRYAVSIVALLSNASLVPGELKAEPAWVPPVEPIPTTKS